MRLFSSLYKMMMLWSRHRHAPYYLLGLSFAESSFFPIPPDAMLAPMALAKPDRAWYYAALATIGSVLGGIAGYMIGALAFSMVHPFIVQFGYADAYATVVAWFHSYGFWAVLVAGFSPIPYKLFTVGAGALSMAFFPFLIASAISRGARFFLVSGLMYWGGERLERLLHRYVDLLGYLFILAVIIFFALKFFF